MIVLLNFSKLIWNELSDVVSGTQKPTKKIVDAADGIKKDKRQMWENIIKF